MIPIGAGARSRLLPVSVPMRYFGAAVAFQVLAWAMLLAGAGDFAAFRGGLGPVFAALHLATLGVLAMTAVGATLQMMPVATRQPVRSIAAAKLAWWLLVAGVAVFAGGAAAYRPRWMAPGALAAFAALAIYAWLLFENLRHARGMPAIRAYGWAALASLAGALALGMALVAHYEHGFALAREALSRAHLVLAAYGFMGLLALGFSCFLLPMFALAPPPSGLLATGVLAAAVVAIAFAVAGFLLQHSTLIAAGAILGLVAAVVHVVMMERSLGRRLRPPLGPAFLLVRVAWGCLVASLVLAAALALGIAPEGAQALFGVLLVPGWLLTFLVAVLQRIVPFLSSVHAGTALASTMTPARTLALHRALHLAALVALALAAVLPIQGVVRLAAALGLAAALVYAAFFVSVMLRLRGARPGGRSDVLQPTN
jgi:hypothetical protein